jgi:hypothetical protein
MGRRALALALCGVLLFACIGASFGAEDSEGAESDVEDIEDAVEPEEDKAFLIVRKYLDDPEVVTGKNYTLKIDLYNAGSGQVPHFRLQIEVQTCIVTKNERADASGRFVAMCHISFMIVI